MTIKTTPTILGAQVFPGIIPSTSHGNVARSDDGQCLFVTRKGVNIVVSVTALKQDASFISTNTDAKTPYLTSCIPPPSETVDSDSMPEQLPSSASNSKRKGLGGGAPVPLSEDVREDVRMGGAGPSFPKRRVRKPEGGEVRWYTTSIEIDREGSRDHVYGWSDLGGETLCPG